MNTERDRFLTEAMGQCWHDFDPDKPLMTYSLLAYVCAKCKSFILGNNDFSVGEDMAKLLKWAANRDDLKDLLANTPADRLAGYGATDQEREEFADAVYRRLKG
jgi:hypothetical protein